MDTSTILSRRVLVVDDDAETSKVVDHMLKILGYDSAICGHAEEALKYVQSQTVDLMLVDYRMPDLTGLDLVSLLRERGWSGPIVMMTGYPAAKDRAAGQDFGIATIVSKPITVPLLAEALEMAFRKKP